MRNNFRKERNKGFTIIEVIVFVIATIIITGLFFLAYTAYDSYTYKDKKNKAISSLENDGYHLIARYQRDFSYPDTSSCTDENSLVSITKSGEKINKIVSNSEYIYCK